MTLYVKFSDGKWYGLRTENPRVGGSNPPLGTTYRVSPDLNRLDSSS